MLCHNTRTELKPVPTVSGKSGLVFISGPVEIGKVLYWDAQIKIYAAESAKTGELARLEMNSHAVLA